MFERIIAVIKASRPLQFAAVFAAGAVVSAVFYPTKQIKETLTKTYESQISTLKQQQSQALATQQTSYQKLSDEYKSYQSQTSSKINELTNQVSNLKSHKKVTITKIVHPDGTVEERTTATTDIDKTEQVTQQIVAEWQQKVTDAIESTTKQFETQISTLQSQWSSKEQTYQAQISTLSQTKTETINPKNFTLDIGMLSDSDYYGHITYTILGPFTLGLQAQFGPSPAAGAGIGLRF